ncbi:MAG: peptide-methionine (S)-S-oxide reductase MsrA [Blastomonas sp.]
MRSALRLFPAFALGAAMLGGTMATDTARAEEARIIPAPKLKASETEKVRVAIFAGGCFWGVEGVYSHVKGVKEAVSGYHGGKRADADYDKVSAGRTRHAEAVRIVYDPSVVSYDRLLQIFFSVVADPTQLNRQGPDRGSQYRSAIIPMNKQQAEVARAYIEQLDKAKSWNKPIVTAVESYSGFYAAERYHQDFMKKNPTHPYIVRWDQAKVDNLARIFPSSYLKSWTAD